MEILNKKRRLTMNVIQIVFQNPDDATELVNFAQSNGVDVIKERNFNGDITTVELFISMGINILTLIVSIINMKIQQNKVSSLKINDDSIELNNVTQDLLEKILRQKFNSSDQSDTNMDIGDDTN